ncbi:MAG: alcohol dehydrogenase catalytic domain-containing protein [Phycisphaera sp.]|nr:alcohol dehydrogenase catalytic domain-containing protein [Phycisphaera sp.]
MQAVVLEAKHDIKIRDIDPGEKLSPRDVRIRIHTVGVCGSDVHYYTHGRIGPFVVEKPMILGHEASGTVLEVGRDVKHLKTGDRVTMEPGIPDPNSKASRLGMYNLDPAVRFWATPPIHGVLRPEVIHPADFTFKVPDNVSFAEAAMVEPLAVGMHAATKAKVKPGDLAVVIGAGPIGMVTALAALAAGCSRVVMADIVDEKLALAATLGPVTPVNVKNKNLKQFVSDMTEGWGADVIFECSGSPRVAPTLFDPLAPGGTVVWVGMPVEPVSFDIVAAQVKEARIETVFRYAHVYPRALALLGSGQINVKPLITDTFPFEKSKEAFDFAVKMPPTSVKAQIELPA